MRKLAGMRYLALGDSYTIGEGVDAALRWPLQLARALREEKIGLRDPRIIATTGWTTDELNAAIDAAEPLGHWDLVSLLIGVNNQYRGRSVADYRGEFRGLLQRAIGFANGRAERVFVVSIPDWGVTPFAKTEARDRVNVSEEIDAFNAAARDIAQGTGVAFVDITPASRANPAQVAEDGLHPDGAMYTAWTQLALPVARTLLAK
ncbi:Lysophospholipase L1 [Lysobacter dokdonensis DS-58]|uniref:Lysophospholipase L1 n=1 Tax=Lysobacter dokdonensis DS-58 TaxID=1300345 RepID=A0A0A2WD20_9GAMM|nr:SGNH/GDSL hydrolase family protein [Lysobacter dokdonensis]KGQ18071.1 Lysophospholipase L1 [Lysobacter dokdonensis DS-58]